MIWIKRHDNDFSGTNAFVSTRKVKIIVIYKNIYEVFNHNSIRMCGGESLVGNNV